MPVTTTTTTTTTTSSSSSSSSSLVVVYSVSLPAADCMDQTYFLYFR